ncbi:Na(+)/H(+) antiporter NhaA [Lyticum sinuosum]|uniref:Na(+)/H(+) antiporter NhaA n=1 Tax=Lyticum sinuosum TaxID=1332059 RepID=A0AAE4VJU6_9RICK|nr:Na(+)/H(+) antiporter NhaA [Lyticum sinuosum]
MLTIIAIAFVNSNLDILYEAITTFKLFEIKSINLEINTLYIVNEILMSVFFLNIGIEIKKEFLYGSLQTKSQMILPILSAIGGFIFPMIIYYLFNYDDDDAMYGIAIPSATDIAFTMAVVLFFRKRIPISIRVFVMALAVVDDIMAIIVIAFKYNNGISYIFIFASIIVILFIYLLKFSKKQKISSYILLGILLWIFIELSGIHATISGVILGLIIPTHKNRKRNKENNVEDRDIAEIINLYIEKPVNRVILPLFAFFNAGMKLDCTSYILEPITLGIALGLLFGKPIGIFLTFLILMRLNLVEMPYQGTYGKMFAASCFCGIGFTMSIFMSTLSFDIDSDLFLMSKLGIILGSSASIILGTISIVCTKKNINI